MKKNLVFINKYEADEGMVFDWAEPHFDIDEEGNEVRQHLYAKKLYLSETDNISNYIEIEKPEEE